MASKSRFVQNAHAQRGRRWDLQRMPSLADVFTMQSSAFWFQDFPVLRLLPILWVSVSVAKIRSLKKVSVSVSIKFPASLTSPPCSPCACSPSPTCPRPLTSRSHSVSSEEAGLSFNKCWSAFTPFFIVSVSSGQFSCFSRF